MQVIFLDLEDILLDEYSYVMILKISKEMFSCACMYGIYDGWKTYLNCHKNCVYIKDKCFSDLLLFALLRTYVLEEHYNKGHVQSKIDFERIKNIILNFEVISNEYKIKALDNCKQFLDYYHFDLSKYA